MSPTSPKASTNKPKGSAPASTPVRKVSTPAPAAAPVNRTKGSVPATPAVVNKTKNVTPGYQQNPVAPQTGGSNAAAIISLITGLLAVFTTCFALFGTFGQIFMGILAVIALVTGFIGMRQAKVSGTGSFAAIVGLILGILALLGLCLMVVLHTLVAEPLQNLINDLIHQYSQ